MALFANRTCFDRFEHTSGNRISFSKGIGFPEKCRFPEIPRVINVLIVHRAEFYFNDKSIKLYFSRSTKLSRKTKQMASGKRNLRICLAKRPRRNQRRNQQKRQKLTKSSYTNVHFTQKSAISILVLTLTFLLLLYQFKRIEAALPIYFLLQP